MMYLQRKANVNKKSEVAQNISYVNCWDGVEEHGCGNMCSCGGC